MRDFFASIVFAIDRRLPGARVGGRESSEAYSVWEYEGGKRILASHAERIGSLAGKDVLDIGCGLGGKSAAYAEAGARVVGVDIETKNVAQSVAFARTCGVGAQFLVGDAECLPFGDRTFDLVVANDSLEHFRNPRASLSEFGRVLRPGGSVFLFFTPWRSPLGSHLYDYIHTPWCHLLFPEWLIRALLERAVAAKGRADAGTEAERLMGEYHSELNRITVSQYHRILEEIPALAKVYEERMPPKFKILAPCARLPFVGEFVTGTCVGMLRKGP